ncbi:hypothetical protein V6N11_018371 [Hibiscus sabdariffa]|uniref:Uncharacterized protein n=1 Tax=Hibiscus sabdariffa TaxID=183260 RepID=A0ABR2T842_9ROSI
MAFESQVQVLLENGKREFDSKSRSANKDNVGDTQKEGHQFEHGIQVDKLKQERDDLSRDLDGLRADYQELCLVFRKAGENRVNTLLEELQAVEVQRDYIMVDLMFEQTKQGVLYEYIQINLRVGAKIKRMEQTQEGITKSLQNVKNHVRSCSLMKSEKSKLEQLEDELEELIKIKENNSVKLDAKEL